MRKKIVVLYYEPYYWLAEDPILGVLMSSIKYVKENDV
jgi:hypothetical protein